MGISNIFKKIFTRKEDPFNDYKAFEKEYKKYREKLEDCMILINSDIEKLNVNKNESVAKDLALHCKLLYANFNVLRNSLRHLSEHFKNTPIDQQNLLTNPSKYSEDFRALILKVDSIREECKKYGVNISFEELAIMELNPITGAPETTWNKKTI